MSVSGTLIIDKPLGLTSHDVVQQVRRMLRLRSVGHAGTLDPLATGVLVVCVGWATRLAEYFTVHDKEYEACICFGVSTDTDDAEGQIVAMSGHMPSRAGLEAHLPSMIGEQMQRPPLRSAIKRAGTPLYKYARRGETVDVALRPVIIRALELLDYGPPRLHLRVECGSGTYVRSLARDLGEQLDTRAYLHGLVRTRSGPFRLTDAVTLEDVWAAVEENRPEKVLRPMATLLHDWPALVLDGSVSRFEHGALVPADTRPDTSVRVFDRAGNLIGIGQATRQGWQPVKVCPRADDNTANRPRAGRGPA